MGAFGVVPEQPLHQLSVERDRVQEKFLKVVVQKFLLDRAVESLAVRIHLRRPGIRVVMGQVQTAHLLRKAFRKLRTIVREHMPIGQGEDLTTETEELLCSLRRVRGGHPRKGKAGEDILEGEDIAATTVDVFLDRIEGHEMSRMRCLEPFGLPQALAPFPYLHCPKVGDLLRSVAQSSHVFHETSSCGGRGQRKAVLPAEWLEEFPHLVLAEVRAERTQTTYLLQEFCGPGTDASVLWRSRLFAERFGLSPSGPELLLPEEQRPPLHSEGIHRCLKTVLLPENEGIEFPACFGGDHMLPPYCRAIAGDETSYAAESGMLLAGVFHRGISPLGSAICI